MSHDGAMVLLREIVDAWVRRDEQKAAKDASSLAFWRNGMLGHLQLIANGKARDSTFVELEKAFEGSAERVEKTIARLLDARGQLGVTPLAEQIDKILHQTGFGKNVIRADIRYLLDNHKSWDERQTADEARSICKSIETLNAELGRLHRMVFRT